MTDCWNIGRVTITKVTESIMEGGVMDTLLPDATPEALLEIGWLRPHFITPSGSLRVSMHALVIATPDHLIVVDTCVGNDKSLPTLPFWDKQQSAFMERFAAAGFEVDRVDYVLCTHLHVDHVGWNTRMVDGRWVPTFPKARYLFAKTEYEYWAKETEGGSDDPLAEVQVIVLQESVQPLFDAGRVDLVDTTHQLCKEVSLVPTPGHTPGHVSIQISSQGETALITGDFVHHPCQIAKPQWASSADADPSHSSRTREKEFSRLAQTSTLVIGTHWTDPSVGHVVRDKGAYRLQLLGESNSATRPHAKGEGQTSR